MRLEPGSERNQIWQFLELASSFAVHFHNRCFTTLSTIAATYAVAQRDRAEQRVKKKKGDVQAFDGTGLRLCKQV
jgi:hypothetical protein